MGAGIYCMGSSPTITNCIISGNSGGVPDGICCHNNSSPTITGCTISGHYFHGVIGNGITCTTSSPTVTDCVISDNAYGITLSVDSKPAITHSTISGNSSSGIYSNTSSPTINSCSITGNQDAGIVGLTSIITIAKSIISGNSGRGGIYCDGNTPSFIPDCTIASNAADYGGGIYCHIAAATITNSIIFGNSATYNGGGIFAQKCSPPIITNSTISGNSGGGVYTDDTSTPTIKNCIFWGDSGSEINNLSTVTYSDIQGGFSGPGNMNTDPRFIDAHHGNFHLASGSQCIDVGTANGAPHHDRDGNPRPQGRGYDMGAYEYSPTVAHSLTTGVYLLLLMP